jgi:hypothetical protein
MPTSTNVFFRAFFALAVAMACVIAPQNGQAAESTDGDAITSGAMLEQCKALQAQRQQMMTDMKAQDTALAEQVAQMNSATADKKLGILAALVTRMADERIANDASMAKMSDAMTAHMMQHMEMGRGSMQGCPMMKGMGMNGMNGMNGMGKNGMQGMGDKTSDPVKAQK